MGSFVERFCDFQDVLVRSAKIASSGEVQEISKIQIDVNEKIYTNLGDGSADGDESTVKIVKTWETSQGYNYEQQTTSGFEWGAGTNIGAQFGLPQVGIGVDAGAKTTYTKRFEETIKESITKTNTVRQESHHEETVKIPPGHKIRVTMKSYSVKYRLDYTMEYKVPKKTSIRVNYCQCCCCCCCCPFLWWFCCGLIAPSCKLSASSILRSMPNFTEDDEYITFTQEGRLKWSADRMEVDKELEKLD